LEYLDSLSAEGRKELRYQKFRNLGVFLET